VTRLIGLSPQPGKNPRAGREACNIRRRWFRRRSLGGLVGAVTATGMEAPLNPHRSGDGLFSLDGPDTADLTCGKRNTVCDMLVFSTIGPTVQCHLSGPRAREENVGALSLDGPPTTFAIGLNVTQTPKH
jgi:hypothetical protein